MIRFFVSFALMCTALTLSASLAHADETFDLELSSTIFTPSGSGTITLATDPGNGTFAFTDYNPAITFNYNGSQFTQNDIFDPADAQFILSDSNGQRQFQFNGNNGPVAFDTDLGGGNFFEVDFSNDTYTTSAEIGNVNYSALAPDATDVPEPGSIAGLTAALLAGACFLRKRRASSTR